MEDYKKSTRDSYNANANIFSEKFKNLTEIQRRYEFSRLIDLLPGKRILDLGCGAGDHSAYFLEKGLYVKAIDISDEMVRLSREKGIDAVVMDIENIDFPKDSFDGIWAVTSLLHIPKAKMSYVAKNLKEILGDGGVLYVCLKEGDGERMIPDKENDGTERFFSFWHEDELNDVFGKYLSLVEFNKTQLKNTVFLQAFFRK